MYSYKYPHPAVTVDCVVFGLDDDELKILLVRRKLEPYKNCWALPGGFVQMDEDLAAAARRELQEETGVKDIYLEQLGAYGTPERDPRERVITIAHLAIVNLFDHPVQPDTDAEEAAWFSLDDLPEPAFDHCRIIKDGLERLQQKAGEEPLVFAFLPEEFTLSQVQTVYEAVLCKSLDKRNFRKKLLATGLVMETEHYEIDVSHRAARFYRFDREGFRAGDEFRVRI